MAVMPSFGAAYYNYGGCNFDVFSTPTSYDSSMSVTGAIELGAPLGANLTEVEVFPLSFSFTDGINTISDATADSATLEFSTNASGAITSWFVGLHITMPSPVSVGVKDIDIFATAEIGFDSFDLGRITTCVSVVGTECPGQIPDFGLTASQPGTWSVVPIPAALPFFASALALLSFAAARRPRKLD